MTTNKTRTVAVRLPQEIAEALEADANELGRTPGRLLRELLTARYSVSARARKTDGASRKYNEGDPDLVEVD